MSAFLQRALQLDAIAVNDGQFVGDSLGAVGTASHQLEGRAIEGAHMLAAAIDEARQAIAFAQSIQPRPDGK
jgi:hypothetical protein